MYVRGFDLCGFILERENRVLTCYLTKTQTRCTKNSTMEKQFWFQYKKVHSKNQYANSVKLLHMDTYCTICTRSCTYIGLCKPTSYFLRRLQSKFGVITLFSLRMFRKSCTLKYLLFQIICCEFENCEMRIPRKDEPGSIPC